MSDTSLAQDYRKADWALVTGASDGIGRALATEAAKAGYNVILSGRRSDRLEAHAESLRRAHYVATVCITADLSDPDAAEALWTEAASQGRIAVLVNAAGLGRNGQFLDPDGWLRESESILVNVISATILMKRALAHMAAIGGGRILNVASAAGFMPGPNMAVYGATKAYLLSLSEAVAEEAAKDAVFVTALCPGATTTGFFTADSADKATLLTRLLPMATPESVAATGWAGLEKGRRVVVTGWMTKGFAFAPRVLPRRLTAWIAGQVFRRRW
ncbi:MAG: SDR family oxidoreductase [Pseudotabrizicola sp.]|uniref:SDR family NAD(P)-dependent oxidoreductase n=1 Tax=Pseudotabrizicola sp. TaxID=2939647 RepID=UPI00271865EF|nr:SDR family oxidoreductase [Pseudotabrizicola sp.]MDO8883893.1 SDR family oxidoreductase [Pseudotabrizicola sp.]MDP2080995.1 SDR family oxidoreductase [Pseudotabrizicola sp.]MDZ7573627.1 SDR family oxidoreductase [Pseudotabrizicola sp.]